MGGSFSPQEELERIAAEIRSCTKCPLAKGRRNAVPGEGPADAEIMFIGEGPGFHEDRQGRPFVGAAGQFLEELLASIGLSREQVYITNVIKCRPPGNRDPLPEELEACRPYLDRQIEVIKPKIIVTLGRYSMARYFPGASITRIHGQPKRVGDIICFPMFHPAAGLHQPRWRPLIEEDIKKLPALLEEARKSASSEAQGDDGNDEEHYEQLSLF
ncbi:MAG TPA: uracil-DNA glycosylase [Caldilineae bacterium]|nr:uracil-DNA glycosylase [Caldilineae bacterium]